MSNRSATEITTREIVGSVRCVKETKKELGKELILIKAVIFTKVDLRME